MSKEKNKFYEYEQVDNLRELLFRTSNRYPDKNAFFVKSQKGGEYFPITYSQFKRDVIALGTYFIERGLDSSNIAILGDNSYEWVVAYFAAVNLKGCVVPIDKELNVSEISNLIKASDSKVIFYSSKYHSLIENLDIKNAFSMEYYRIYEDNMPCFTNLDMDAEKDFSSIIKKGYELLDDGDDRFLKIKIDNSRCVNILFTSGTTGNPKGVMLTHKNILANVSNVSKIVDVREDDISLSLLPIHHTFEFNVNILNLINAGGAIAFFEGLKYVSKNLVEIKASILVAVPLIFESMYQKIWKTAKKNHSQKLLKKAIKMNNRLRYLKIDRTRTLFHAIHNSFGGNLRLMIVGAASMDVKVLQGFIDFGFKVCQGYGMTEASPLIAGTPDFFDNRKKAGSCGPVVPDGEIKIVDKGKDGIGEIIYKGPNVMLGYMNMKEETASVLKDGWLYTGDLGFLDNKGWLHITGRKKNVIVTSTGKNIYPEELESLINKEEYIEECLVYGFEDEDKNGETVVAVQVKPALDKLKSKMDTEDIKNFIQDRLHTINELLPSYKRIRRVVIREHEFEKTTTNKLKRKANISEE